MPEKKRRIDDAEEEGDGPAAEATEQMDVDEAPGITAQPEPSDGGAVRAAVPAHENFSPELLKLCVRLGLGTKRAGAGNETGCRQASPLASRACSRQCDHGRAEP